MGTMTKNVADVIAARCGMNECSQSEVTFIVGKFDTFAEETTGQKFTVLHRPLLRGEERNAEVEHGDDGSYFFAWLTEDCLIQPMG